MPTVTLAVPEPVMLDGVTEQSLLENLEGAEHDKVILAENEFIAVIAAVAVPEEPRLTVSEEGLSDNWKSAAAEVLLLAGQAVTKL